MNGLGQAAHSFNELEDARHFSINFCVTLILVILSS